LNLIITMQALDSRIDWSDREKCELIRLHQAFPAPAYQIDCGTSDRRDPWCVVTDCERDEIILHIARIDQHYVLANGDGFCRNFDRLSDAIKLAIRQKYTGAWQTNSS